MTRPCSARRPSVSGKAHKRIPSPGLADYLAVMSRAVFQAGLSWAAIDRQWEALSKVFHGFAPRKVARYGEADVKRIMATPGILHSESKIRATIRNAATLLALDQAHHGFRVYLRSHGSYARLAADLKERFAYIGDISVYYFLFRVGERVPPFTRWIATVKGDHPRIREMVSGVSPRKRI
jgi:3-methyladenine DNA glycosylase Tag